MQKMTISGKLKLMAFGLLFASCNSEPKVIESVSSTPGNSGTAIVDGMPTIQPDGTSEQHKVVVKEVLDTEKYTYMNVTENGSEFWVAVSKREIEIGGTYYFRGGLLKKNFQSREYNRVFETLYLVSDLRKEGGLAIDEALTGAQGGATPSLEPPANITPAAGAIKISELVANLKKYEGKQVKITGKCVKVNPMIMGRNWVHIQDGSGKNLDLTVTTMENIPLGHVVTVEGTFVLDKDFGAGYRYDYILEGASLK